MLGRDRRQRRRRVAAVGAAGVAVKKHHDAKEANADGAPDPGVASTEGDRSAEQGDLAATMDNLKQLGALHDEGVLTDAEFEAEKAKLLGARS
jgi:putative oligomerization/nucleic acid binding protein